MNLYTTRKEGFFQFKQSGLANNIHRIKIIITYIVKDYSTHIKTPIPDSLSVYRGLSIYGLSYNPLFQESPPISEGGEKSFYKL